MSQEQMATLAAHTVSILGTKYPKTLTIKGRLPGLNEYIDACRTGPHKGNDMKRQTQDTVMWYILSQLRGVRFKRPVFLLYTFYEPNRKRDMDNVSSFARKCIQDALVQCGTLKNDGWGHVTGSMDFFDVDANNPRIVVEFVEQEVAPQCKERPNRN